MLSLIMSLIEKTPKGVWIALAASAAAIGVYLKGRLSGRKAGALESQQRATERLITEQKRATEAEHKASADKAQIEIEFKQNTAKDPIPAKDVRDLIFNRPKSGSEE